MSTLTATLVEPRVAPVDVLAVRKDLWKTYHKAGAGSSVENDLVKQYLPLVKTVVGRMAMSLPPHVSSEDLYSSGLVGLLNALRRYDPKCGTSFETYSRTRIKGAILDELRRLDWVPRSIHSKAKEVEKVMQQIQQKKGDVVTEEEMARAMKMTIEDYRNLLDQIRPATFICLDSVRTGEFEDGSSRYDCMPDDRSSTPDVRASTRELSQIIAERLEQLPEMQRKVLALYYFEDLRLREIAEILGVTESRICQIHSQAILSIKSYLKHQDSGTF
jgi:RNA polymerase sigma factor for flagellar operon FliA